MEELSDCEKVKEQMELGSIVCCDLCHQNTSVNREHQMFGMVISGHRYEICCRVMDKVIEEEERG